MRFKVNTRPQKRLHNMPMPTLCNSNRHTFITLASSLLVIIATIALLTGLVLAQELEYPAPITPINGATGVKVSPPVVFSWKPFYVGTQEYTFQLSKNPDMNPTTVNTTIKNGATTYQYRTALEYDTTYWWRVMATKPPGGEWGLSSFTTEAAPSSNTTGSTDSTSESFLSSIVAFLEDIGWPVVGLIAGAVIIVIIALIFLLKPKAKPAAQRQWQGMQPPSQMKQPYICPTCGLQNSPDRKFCSNCGASLISSGPQQTWGAQQPNICPACSSPYSPGQKFCNNCGSSLAAGGPLPLPPPQQQQQQWQVYQNFTCPICGSNINKGVNPCPNCRTWLDWGA
jgi:DNA-directed RNA polymerase subunit RPC12/RpoP